jgi:hypothetical protein
MSLVSFDIADIVERILSSTGWKKSGLQPGRSIHPGIERQTKIYEKGEDVTVVSRPFSPFGSLGVGLRGRMPSIQDINEMFEQHLKYLAEILRRIRKAYSGKLVIVFPSL